MKLKVLNLYAGIGGNRELWDNVKVTAVEIDKEIAEMYLEKFPADKMIIGDAHQYLLDNFDDFDFIWSSPPCPTHSRARFSTWGKWLPVYPDLSLYQEVIFLQNYFKGKWVVENVISFYDPLIKPRIILDRHYIWSNFIITKKDFKPMFISDLAGSFKPHKVKRNMVNPELALHILDCAINEPQKKINEVFRSGILERPAD